MLCKHEAVCDVKTRQCDLSTRGNVICQHEAVCYVNTRQCVLSTRSSMFCQCDAVSQPSALTMLGVLNQYESYCFGFSFVFTFLLCHLLFVLGSSKLGFIV